MAGRDADGGPGKPVPDGGVGYSCLAEIRTVETILHGAPAPVSAQVFANGTPYQTITIPGGTSTTVMLQWNAVWPAPGAGGS